MALSKLILFRLEITLFTFTSPPKVYQTAFVGPRIQYHTRQLETHRKLSFLTRHIHVRFART